MRDGRLASRFQREMGWLQSYWQGAVSCRLGSTTNAGSYTSSIGNPPTEGPSSLQLPLGVPPAQGSVAGLPPGPGVMINTPMVRTQKIHRSIHQHPANVGSGGPFNRDTDPCTEWRASSAPRYQSCTILYNGCATWSRSRLSLSCLAEWPSGVPTDAPLCYTCPRVRRSPNAPS